MNYNQIRNELKTGDIVLFSGKNHISDLIKWASRGPWSHVGMIVRVAEYDMVMLWESTTLSNVKDWIDQKYISGVQLVSLTERLCKYNGDVAVRLLNQPLSVEQKERLAALRRQLRGRPYEQNKLELIKSAYDGPLGTNHVENLQSIFCSEQVAEAYQRMGLLAEPPVGLPSNEYTPVDFSTAARQLLPLLAPYELGEEIPLTLRAAA